MTRLHKYVRVSLDLKTMLSTTHNFLFIHIPKTGGNSIQRLLQHVSDDKIAKIQPTHDGIERFGVISSIYATHKHSTLEEYRTQYGNSLFSGLYKICCIRNTYDRLISFYFSPHRGKIIWNREHFLEFIEHVPPMSHYLTLSGSDEDSDPFSNVDYVLRFEHLYADWLALCDQIGIPEVPLPHINRSPKNYSAYYDSELKAIVLSLFRFEIERFEFEP